MPLSAWISAISQGSAPLGHRASMGSGNLPGRFTSPISLPQFAHLMIMVGLLPPGWCPGPAPGLGWVWLVYGGHCNRWFHYVKEKSNARLHDSQKKHLLPRPTKKAARRRLGVGTSDLRMDYSCFCSIFQRLSRSFLLWLVPYTNTPTRPDSPAPPIMEPPISCPKIIQIAPPITEAKPIISP